MIWMDLFERLKVFSMAKRTAYPFNFYYWLSNVKFRNITAQSRASLLVLKQSIFHSVFFFFFGRLKCFSLNCSQHEVCFLHWGDGFNKDVPHERTHKLSKLQQEQVNYSFSTGPGCLECALLSQLYTLSCFGLFMPRVRLHTLWCTAARTAGRSEACWVFREHLWKILMMWEQRKDRHQLTKRGQ